jgi:hypothetical protein
MSGQHIDKALRKFLAFHMKFRDVTYQEQREVV